MILTSLVTKGLLYVLTGVFAGFMSGTLGIGGGIIVVPALLILFQEQGDIPAHLSMQFAAGTSLAIMVFTSQSAVIAHYRLGEILWPVFQRLLGGIVLGTCLGVILADCIPSVWLILLLIIFLAFVVVKMLGEMKAVRPKRVPATWFTIMVSLVIGFISGLLGLGGGLLMIPYLSYCGVEIRKMAAISALGTMTVAVTGTLTLMVLGFNKTGMPPETIGYVYWPAVLWIALPSVLIAPLGARLTYILPVKQLKYGFIVILLMMIIHLLYAL